MLQRFLFHNGISYASDTTRMGNDSVWMKPVTFTCYFKARLRVNFLILIFLLCHYFDIGVEIILFLILWDSMEIYRCQFSDFNLKSDFVLMPDFINFQPFFSKIYALFSDILEELSGIADKFYKFYFHNTGCIHKKVQVFSHL